MKLIAFSSWVMFVVTQLKKVGVQPWPSCGAFNDSRNFIKQCAIIIWTLGM